ncbi:hypothetical protein FH972_022334 [Carpinus fangiana]|uniref:GPN-loop GTPase 2 n=1 Tax=Carpinus fangiana TaxID=176857 RepID=A0A5N6KSM3_9ROSI|nr:hypothetical protein FH972_022334 [Carpinus fangiana]
MPFAQLVIGPPGSGKSTYCDGMQQFMAAIERPCSIVNLDPANDHTSYPAALDVRDLVTLDEIMEAEDLGPNGGVLYALEELEHNFEWLEEGLGKLNDEYILFDCPGQVELFTHHASLRNIFFRLQKLGYRVRLPSRLPFSKTNRAVCSSCMLQLDLPHLNVLTKIDNLASHGPLPLPLDFYTDASGLEYLLPYLEDEMSRTTPGVPPQQSTQEHTQDTATPTKQTSTRKLRTNIFDKSSDSEEDDPDNKHPPTPPSNASKFTALNAAILDLVADYALVGFETLCVEDRASMRALLAAIDRASGYAIGAGPSSGPNAGADVWRMALKEPAAMSVKDVEERWITRRASFDALERKQWEAEGRAERGETGSTRAQRKVFATEGEARAAMDSGSADEDALGPVRKVARGMGDGHGGVKVVRK